MVFLIKANLHLNTSIMLDNVKVKIQRIFRIAIVEQLLWNLCTAENPFQPEFVVTSWLI